MSFLSLNETTLYYYFLRDRMSDGIEKFSEDINDWAASIPDNAELDNKADPAPTSTRRTAKVSTPSGSQIPALTNATSRSTNTSVLSENIKISQNVNIKVKEQAQPNDTSIEIVELGLEDDDETTGVERQAALMSPPKGKARVSSAVTNQFFTRLPPLTQPNCLLIGDC
jgi:hypothetical protein